MSHVSLWACAVTFFQLQFFHFTAADQIIHQVFSTKSHLCTPLPVSVNNSLLQYVWVALITATEISGLSKIIHKPIWRGGGGWGGEGVRGGQSINQERFHYLAQSVRYVISHITQLESGTVSPSNCHKDLSWIVFHKSLLALDCCMATTLRVFFSRLATSLRYFSWMACDNQYDTAWLTSNRFAVHGMFLHNCFWKLLYCHVQQKLSHKFSDPIVMRVFPSPEVLLREEIVHKTSTAGLIKLCMAVYCVSGECPTFKQKSKWENPSLVEKKRMRIADRILKYTFI